jgi:hypothetical protein
MQIVPAPCTETALALGGLAVSPEGRYLAEGATTRWRSFLHQEQCPLRVSPNDEWVTWHALRIL